MGLNKQKKQLFQVKFQREVGFFSESKLPNLKVPMPEVRCSLSVNTMHFFTIYEAL